MTRWIVTGALLLGGCAASMNRSDGDTGRTISGVEPVVRHLTHVNYDLLWAVAREVVAPYQFDEENKDAGIMRSRTSYRKDEAVPLYTMVEVRFKIEDAVTSNWKFAVWAYRLEKVFESGRPFEAGDVGRLAITGTHEQLQREIAQEIMTRYLSRRGNAERQPSSPIGF